MNKQIKLKGFDKFYKKHIQKDTAIFKWKHLVDAVFIGVIIFILLNIK